MLRNALCYLIFALTLSGCDDSPVEPPVTSAPPKFNGGLLVYESDEELVRSELTETASPRSLIESLDPNPDKTSIFVKSGYETSAQYGARIVDLVGDQHRYAIVVPARLEYDADSQRGSFCVAEPISISPQCVFPFSSSPNAVNLGGWAAGQFTGGWVLNVSANKLKAQLMPISLSANMTNSKRAADGGKVRLAFVFTLVHPFKNGRFAQTTGQTLYDTNSEAKVVLQRIVAYEQNGAVLATQDF